MVRHVPWDEMPYHYAPNKHTLKRRPVETETPVVVTERTLENDIREIGLRTSFGLICGGLSGGLLKTVEVLRDVKAMSADKRKTTTGILRFAGQLGGFFGVYHGVRKTLELTLKQPWEDNIFFGSVIALSPFVVLPKFRPLFPYGVVLICLDTFNEYQDNSP